MPVLLFLQLLILSLREDKRTKQQADSIPGFISTSTFSLLLGVSLFSFSSFFCLLKYENFFFLSLQSSLGASFAFTMISYTMKTGSLSGYYTFQPYELCLLDKKCTVNSKAQVRCLPEVFPSDLLSLKPKSPFPRASLSPPVFLDDAEDHWFL